jgi:Kef-type K+ transport system membrane component KefB
MALALATGLVSSGGPSFLNIGRTALVTVLFLVCAVTVLPRLFARYGTAQFNILLSFSPPVYVLAVCLLFVLAAYAARIHLVFGAFSAGLCIGSMDEPRLDAGKSLFRKISLAFFVPLYFAMVGIKIDLIRYFDAGLFLFFLFFATVCAGTGTFLAARYAGGGWRTSLDFAVAMNARGILGVVLASEALNLGIINGTFFSVLVMVSIMTTLAAGFWFRCPFFKQRVLRYD